jgi:hypothetical protein
MTEWGVIGVTPRGEGIVAAWGWSELGLGSGRVCGETESVSTLLKDRFWIGDSISVGKLVRLRGELVLFARRLGSCTVQQICVFIPSHEPVIAKEVPYLTDGRLSQF